jgi:hypothetical protein
VSDKGLVNVDDVATISANWVNTSNPWADNEVADALTVTGYMQDADINTFAKIQTWVSDKTLVNEEDIFTIDANWVNTANPWADNEVADNITIDQSDDVDTAGTDISAALLARSHVLWDTLDNNDSITVVGTDTILSLYRDPTNDTTTFKVNGAIKFVSSTSGPFISNSGIETKNAATSAGFVDFYEDSDDGTNKLRFIAQAMASDFTYTWPTDDGTANQVLQSNGSGTLVWTTVDLATDVTGTLPEANGGTGDTDLDDIIGGTAITVTDGANAIIGGNATIAVTDDGIDTNHFAARDWTDMTVAADGKVTLDNDVVAAAEMADADHGDVSWSSGVATVEAGTADSAATAAKLTGDADTYVDIDTDTTEITDSDTSVFKFYPNASNQGVIENELGVVINGGTGPLTSDSMVTDRIFPDTIKVTNEMQIPNDANPTTNVEGEMAWDSDDDAPEYYLGDQSASALSPVLRTMSALIWNPDLITDTVPIFYVDSMIYQGGIEIVRAELQTSEDGAYSLIVPYYTAADPPVLSDYIDTLVVGASDQRIASTTFENSTIARGQIVNIITPATDIDWIRVSLTYYVKENN